jgi:DNA repair exonuclease SbcCD ATPase subunit
MDPILDLQIANRELKDEVAELTELVEELQAKFAAAVRDKNTAELELEDHECDHTDCVGLWEYADLEDERDDALAKLDEMRQAEGSVTARLKDWREDLYWFERRAVDAGHSLAPLSIAQIFTQIDHILNP